MNNTYSIPVVAAAVLLGGCATLEPAPGFDEVSQAVEQRAGSRIHWRQGGPEDAEVAAHVRELLQSGLTTEKAVQVALLANPRLQATYEELGIARADLVQAGLLRNPVFSAVRLTSPEHINLDYEIAWDFLGLFTLPLRKQAAERDFEAAKQRVTIEVLDLAGDVRSAFYQAQANAQLVEMWQEVTFATEAAQDAAEGLRAAGNITAVALDQQRALHQESRLMLAAAELALADSRERLNALMGLWGTAIQWEMAPRLPKVPGEALDLTEVEKRAVARSLDLALLRLQMEGLAKRVGITDVTSVIPDAEIGYVWERDDGEWENGPSLAFPVPIFDFGQAKRARVRAQLEQLRARYKELAIQVRSSARSAARAAEMARARERHLREVLLPLRERITQGMQLEYNAMQVGVFRLLQTQQQQIATGQRYVEALREYWLARARLEQILNGRLAGIPSMSVAPAGGAAMGSDAGGH